METSIKDLILRDTQEIAEHPRKTAGARRRSVYETVIVSGPDFAVRKTGQRSSSLLVCIPSKGQFYVKNEGNGEMVPFSVPVLNRFLSDVPADDVLHIQDSAGNEPFWISSLERSHDFLENLMTALSSECLRGYFCRDMLCMNGIFTTLRNTRKRRYAESPDRFLAAVDPKRAGQVFDEIARFLPRCEVKAGFCRFADSTGYNDSDKVRSIFEVLLRSEEEHMRYYSRRTHERVWDWLERNWGIEGVKRFIRTCMETPVSVCPDNLEESGMIQRTVFPLGEFLDYCFGECTRQGYSENPRNFIQSWEDCLELQRAVYGKVRDKYPEHLASEEVILSYRLSKLREAQQIRGFDEAAARLRHFESRTGKYLFLAPSSPADMIEEGRMQSNCVASYIDRVISGECMIFFMRARSEPDRSLVTIEIRNGEIVQMKAKYNREPSPEQREAARAWAEDAFRDLAPGL